MITSVALNHRFSNHQLVVHVICRCFCEHSHVPSGIFHHTNMCTHICVLGHTHNLYLFVEQFILLKQQDCQNVNLASTGTAKNRLSLG